MRISLCQNLDSYNIKETKKKVKDYFRDLEKIKWEQARLDVQRGLIAKYKISPEDKNKAYIIVRKDEFNLSAKENKNEELQKQLAEYYFAKSILSEEEQAYIIEYFINGKYEDEVVDLLGYNGTDDRGFRKLKRYAIYKFAYVLNLVV